MSYYTPPPSTGSSWTPPMTFAHHAQPSITATTAPNSATSQQHPGMSNPMLAMMAMMQMQHSFPQGLPPNYATQTQTPTPVVDGQKAAAPQTTDDNMLAQIIHEQVKRGLTYKAALESLHGHKGIPAFNWKDYYLEHKQHIDGLVNKLTRGSSTSIVKTEKESSPHILVESFSRGNNNRVSEKPVENGVRKEKAKSRTPITTSHTKGKGKAEENNFGVAERAGSQRRTLNSLCSTPAPSLLANVPSEVAIDPSTGLPAAPSRSPSPPTALTLNQNTRGAQKYTEEDAIFFYRRIAYDLARNPDLTKIALCDILAKKAPHHSSLSWRTYWIRHEDVADKMLLLTELDEEDREEVIRSWKTGTSVTANGNGRERNEIKVSYLDHSGSGSSISECGSESVYSEGDSGDDEDAVGSTDDDEELGEAGSPFTMAEMRVLAKYIASVQDWFKGFKEWNNFTSTYTQRTPASWKEYYRRKQNDIDILAKRYMKRTKKQQQTVKKQRGRPSWASQGGSSRPSLSNAVSADDHFVKRGLEGAEERLGDKRARVDEY